MLGDDFNTTSNMWKQNILKSSSFFVHLLLQWFKGSGLLPQWLLTTKGTGERLSPSNILQQQLSNADCYTEECLLKYHNRFNFLCWKQPMWSISVLIQIKQDTSTFYEEYLKNANKPHFIKNVLCIYIYIYIIVVQHIITIVFKMNIFVSVYLLFSFEFYHLCFCSQWLNPGPCTCLSWCPHCSNPG